MQVSRQIVFQAPDERVRNWWDVPGDMLYEPCRYVYFTLLHSNLSSRYLYECQCLKMRTSSFVDTNLNEVPEDVMEEMLIHVQMSHEVTRTNANLQALQ